MFSLHFPREVSAGAGARSRLPALLSGSRRAALITDEFLSRTDIYKELSALAASSGSEIMEIVCKTGEPSANDILKLYNSHDFAGCDKIVGFGGGSVLDTAKILSVIPANNALTGNLLDGAAIKNPGIPCVMIPTTAGTGSEATPNSILLNPENNVKTGVISPLMIASHVLLDPEVTYGLPPRLTAATGFDALAHNIECFFSKKATPFSDLFAAEGIRLIFRSLRTACENPRDESARLDMLLASYYGGASIAASSTTAAHAMAYPLSGMFHMPHSEGVAVLLPHIIGFNRQSCTALYARLARMLGMDGNGDEQLADRFVNAVFNLADECGLKLSIVEAGAKEEHLPQMVSEAMEIKRLFDNNPTVMTAEDVEAVYRKLL